MNNINKASWPRTFLACGLVTCAISVASHAKEMPARTDSILPASVIGTWQVAEVHVDTGATRTLRYQLNDPRLTGRIFTIDTNSLSTNTPEEKSCAEPKVATRIKTVANLIETSMAGRATPPEVPKQKDYNVRFPADAKSDAFTVNCKTGVWAASLGRQGGVSGAWVVVLPQNKLAIRWYDETILILNKMPENAKPIASYSCQKASTSVEKTICGSVPLAAYDRSVAESYAYVAKQLKEAQNSDALNRLKTEQKEWLAKRNSCGAEVGCLEKSMSDRLERIDASAREG